MKKIFLSSILFLACTIQAEFTKTVTPKPNKATIYLSGAELSYNIPLYLAQGSHEIIIEGVSPNLDPSSISAYLKGAYVVDTRKSIRYPEQAKVITTGDKYQKSIERINDSLDELSFVIKDCTNKKTTYEKEKYLLLNNRLMKGEYTKDSLSLLKASLDLLRVRMIHIDEELLQLDRRLYKHYKLQSVLSNRKTHFQKLINNGGVNLDEIPFKAIEQIIVTIEAESAITSSLNLRYYVASAGWLPTYDIQAISGSNSINLISRAQVSQNTGVDWKDVSLVLSTSNPNQGHVKPMLNIWNLQFGYPDSYLEKKSKNFSTNSYNNHLQYNNAPKLEINNLDVNASGNESSLDFSANAAPIFSMSENLLRTEYVIKSKYSIESDYKYHNVVINNVEIPVDMSYVSVPKLDKSAFLMAKIANWEDLNLLPANARIYFDESYIGMSIIDPGTVKDTMYLDMGRDRSINIKRMNLKDKCKEQVLGDDKIHIKTVEITIRNTKNVSLDFEVEDQIPISSDPNIKVTLLNKDGALYNDQTGKLIWKLKIKPKDTKKIVFSFEVRHPKNKVVANL